MNTPPAPTAFDSLPASCRSAPLPVILFWVVINAVLFAGMIAHQAANSTETNRSGVFYTLAIVLALFPAIIALIVSVHSGFRVCLASLPVAIGSLRVPLLIGVCLGIVGLWLPAGEAFLPRLSITFNLVYLCILLVSVSSSELADAGGRLDWLLPALFIALVVLAFFSAARFPVEHPGLDEIGFSDYARSWLTSGQIYYRVIGAPLIDITAGTGYWLVPYSLWMDTFGISLSTARGFMLIIYLCGALLTGWAASRHFGYQIGWLAAVLFAASPFVLAHRWLRPELIMTIPVALIVGLLAQKRHSVLAAFAIGLTAALSLDIHGSGIVLIAGTSIVFIISFLQDIFVQRALRLAPYLAFAVGGVMGGMLFLISHIFVLDNPSGFFTTVSGTRGFLQGLSSENLQNFWAFVTEVSIFDMLLLGLVCVSLASTRLKHNWAILTLLITGIICYVVVVPNGQRYIAGWMPVMVVGLAGIIGFGLRATPDAVSGAGGFWRVTAAVALSGFCISQSLRHVSLADPFPEPAMPERTSMIREVIDNTDVVIAGDLNDYWYMLDTPNFYATVSDFEIVHHITPQPPYSVWADIQPQIIYHTNYASNVALGPYISAWLRDNDYLLVEEFTLDGLLTRIWMHDDYLARRASNPG
jgi:hypothetical protein